MTSLRVWEIDAFRGAAMVLMVVFHFFFDLNYLGLASFSLYDGPLLLLQRATAFLFLSLVGVSLVLARTGGVTLWRNVKRAMFLAAVALFITLATWVYPHNGFIVFGVIHLIAVSVLLGFFFVRFSALLNLLFGSLAFALGFLVSSVPVSFPWLVWLGFKFPGFYTLDFYPLLPWFGLVLFGIAFGKTFYAERKSLLQPVPSLKPLAFLGRHALALYLIHQPVLFGLLFAYRMMTGG
ncbi:DUF1624 domain-containing protein [Candidatus Micrarchaeota archaeon]|nr:DUF1624 domain-containing protein [Candidatus Micrarchaeota archaeon]